MIGWVIGLVGVIVVGVGGWTAWSLKTMDKELTRLPRTAIKDLVAGQRVRVIGIARKLAEDTAGPYTGKVCLATHAWVSTSGNDATPPDTDRIVPFRVEDETGSVELFIGHGHVKMRLAGELVDMDKSKAFGASIIRREAGSSMYSNGPSGPRYWEDRLDVDGKVAAIGYVTRKDDGAYHLTGTPDEPLIIANVSRAFG